MSKERKKFWWKVDDAYYHLAGLYARDKFVCGRQFPSRVMTIDIESIRCPDCAAGRRAADTSKPKRTVRERKGVPNPGVKNQLVREAGGKCEVCGYKPAQRHADKVLHLHHVLPRVRGGDNCPTNLVIVCANCHAIAHATWGHRRKYRWDGPPERLMFIEALREVCAGRIPWTVRGKFASDSLDGFSANGPAESSG